MDHSKSMHVELSTVWLSYLYRTSIEVVMSKDMKYVHRNLIRSPMTTRDNDAKSCYYRILASMALMVIHHFGVPERFAEMLVRHFKQCNSDFERGWVILQNFTHIQSIHQSME